MSSKFNVAFLWHLHQPFYRDPAQGKYVLPWVRLHGIKGYTDMLEAVRRFFLDDRPGVPAGRVTFSFSPCLLKQLEDLTTGGQTDLYFELSLKSPDDLEVVEKKIILRHFFAANWETMVLRYPRYRDLLYRRSRHVSESELDSALRRFSSQDFLDLQVWFNLTWFGWASEEKHALIPQLKRKGRDFSPDEKRQILRLQQETINRIIPEYKTAWKEGLIEISISPFYHPILPLLIDNYSARISQPHDPMPRTQFKRPEDALEQLARGRDYAGRILGQMPEGLWPSEGSVSPAACELAGKVGFKWLATDEAVLLATLHGRPGVPAGQREEALYQAYRTADGGPAIVFRDRYLSDAIGFRYARNTPKQSVDDFVGHLENIVQRQPHPGSSVAAVILDGENAWEYFNDGGRGFFAELYGRLSQHPLMTTRTVGEYLRENPPKTVLPPIFPASWISGSFRIWIGDPVKNLAWNCLKQSADVVDAAIKKNAKREVGPASLPVEIQRAREYLLTAQGSDWFWWYGEPNSSDFDLEFDQLFRLNQIQIYKELDLPIPVDLTRPLKIQPEVREEMPLFPMNPVIDGRETTFYEWIGARSLQASDYSGSMYLTTPLLNRIYYGISTTHLFLRLNPSVLFRDLRDPKIAVRFVGEGQCKLEIVQLRASQIPRAVWKRESVSPPSPPVEIKDVAYHKILEIAVPFSILPRVENEVHFAIIILNEKLEVERWPRMGSYACPWPTAEYLTKNWVV